MKAKQSKKCPDNNKQEGYFPFITHSLGWIWKTNNSLHVLFCGALDYEQDITAFSDKNVNKQNDVSCLQSVFALQ